MSEHRKHPELSERERQLITLAGEGLTDTAIAHRLGISEPTVKSYWGRVRSKLGPYNRTELVAQSLREEGAQVISDLSSEIARLKGALSESETGALELQREILEHAPDAVFAVDEHGSFVWINLEAERMFDYRFDEIAGRHVSLLVPQELQAQHREHMRQYFLNPGRKHMGQHLATVAICKGGRKVPIAATLASIETTNGRIVTCFVRELSGSADAFLFGEPISERALSGEE